MKICVLLPNYTTTNVDYKNYDPPRNLQKLLPNCEVETLFLNKLTTYKQLQEAGKKGFDIFVNLCEGYLDWEVPSIDVITSLDLLNLPYTGTNATLYDPSKELMKYVAFCSNVATPNYCLLNNSTGSLKNSVAHLQYPLFVKPSKAGDSLGIDSNSIVNNEIELEIQAKKILKNFDELLIEEYIDGRELTVLVSRNSDLETATTYPPIEYIFTKNFSFKTYSLKTSELHPNSNIEVVDVAIVAQLQIASQAIFAAFNGEGYARLDFRMDKKGNLFFLEINFTCSVFYEDGFEGSADYILKQIPNGQQKFLKNIIAEGIARHCAKQKLYYLQGNTIAGYGIFAKKNIAKNEIIFKGEEKSQRIVTKQFINNNWNETQQQDFARYAYPISKNVYILWDTNAAEWAPQNHSCQANTTYFGLNVIALKNIKKNEELTLDYATFLDETAMEFDCNCQSIDCRKKIKGTVNNTVDNRLH
jgi:D-alanine-D-alanine ligase-like ATP-grasp enzyme